MTSAERQLIDEKFNGLAKLVNTQFTNMHERLDKIEKQTTKTNERVNELEKANLTHVTNCPNSVKIRALEDNQLTTTTARKLIIISITLTASVVSVLWVLFQYINYGKH